MSIYLHQIKQLISLQRVDDEIHVIKVELEGAPRELEALRIKFAEVSEQRTRQQDKMAHLHEQEKRLGLEIEDDSMRIKKSKSKLMLAGNSKEYHAMVREMDSMERVNRGREEEKITLLDELALQTAAQEAIEELFATIEKELAACEAGLQERVAKATAQMDRLMARRDEAAREVPMPVFTRYEFIRERLQHPVIVPVVNGVCAGCNISIPPQGFIELQKGQQILSCPNCQRLMYWEEFMNEEKSA